MEKKIYIIFLVLFCVFETYSQNNYQDTLKLEVIYVYKYQKNKTDTTSVQMENMVLKISNSFSYYISLNKLKIREMSKAYRNSNSMPTNLNTIARTKIHHTVLKDYNKKQTVICDVFGLNSFSYTENTNDYKWNLHPEKKDILGYSCKKATTTFAGRDYVAWYTTDIPIPDGPYKFKGLPGLILFIHDTNNHYSFEANSILQAQTIFNAKGLIYKNIATTKEDFFSVKKRFKEKPSSMMNAGGLQFPKELLDKADRIAKERMKYENNPLELNENDE